MKLIDTDATVISLSQENLVIIMITNTTIVSQFLVTTWVNIILTSNMTAKDPTFVNLNTQFTIIAIIFIMMTSGDGNCILILLLSLAQNGTVKHPPFKSPLVHLPEILVKSKLTIVVAKKGLISATELYVSQRKI